MTCERRLHHVKDGQTQQLQVTEELQLTRHAKEKKAEINNNLIRIAVN